MTAVAAMPAAGRFTARSVPLVAAAILAGLMFNEMSTLVGDAMVAAMLLLVFAIPFAWAFGRSPAMSRARP